MKKWVCKLEKKTEEILLISKSRSLAQKRCVPWDAGHILNLKLKKS